MASLAGSKMVFDESADELWGRYQRAQEEQRVWEEKRNVALLPFFTGAEQFVAAIDDIKQDDLLKPYWIVLLVGGYASLEGLLSDQLQELESLSPEPIDLDPWAECRPCPS
jgi:hypothetical protein